MKNKVSPTTKDQALSLVSSIVSTMQKSCKSCQVLSSADLEKSKIKYHSTRVFQLDEIISNGKGMPKAKAIEVFGPENSGKTHLLYAACRQVQSEGRIAIIGDIENRYSMEYIVNEIGLNPELLIIAKPHSVNEWLDDMLAQGYLNNPLVGIVGIDSIGAMVTDQEMDGELVDANIGAQAKMVTRWINRATKKQTHPDAPTIFVVNQLRDNVGAMYGADYKVPGGRVLKFLLSVRIKVRKVEFITNKEGETIGQKVELKIVKNSVGVPDKDCEVHLIFGKGYSNAHFLRTKFFPKRKVFEFHLNEKDYKLNKEEFSNWLNKYPKKALALWNQLKLPSQKPESSPSAVVEVSSELLLNTEEEEEEKIPI